jgi:hypothetical protein
VWLIRIGRTEATKRGSSITVKKQCVRAGRGEGEKDRSTERLNLVGAQRESRGVDRAGARDAWPMPSAPTPDTRLAAGLVKSRHGSISSLACSLPPAGRMDSRACA